MKASHDVVSNVLAGATSREPAPGGSSQHRSPDCWNGLIPPPTSLGRAKSESGWAEERGHDRDGSSSRERQLKRPRLDNDLESRDHSAGSRSRSV